LPPAIALIALPSSMPRPTEPQKFVANSWESLAFRQNRAQHPAIDRSRLALVGFSQGAALALTTGIATPDIGAVVDYFGPSVAGWYISRFIGYGQHLPKNWLDRLPPVLILHGARDPIVSVADSRKLDAALQQRGKIVELHVYPNSMHALNDPKSGSEKAQATAQDARERALRFLDTHLAPRTVVR
jgi:dipeptidyl aminopeptidase/acylaminoacyl peptidase